MSIILKMLRYYFKYAIWNREPKQPPIGYIGNPGSLKFSDDEIQVRKYHTSVRDGKEYWRVDFYPKENILPKGYPHPDFFHPYIHDSLKIKVDDFTVSSVSVKVHSMSITSNCNIGKSNTVMCYKLLALMELFKKIRIKYLKPGANMIVFAKDINNEFINNLK